MPWLRIDDRMYCNRKVLGVSNDAKALWTWAMGYSSDQLTDGILRPHEVQMLAGMVRVSNWQAVANELVAAGLFEQDGETYMIHDYLKYNPSREQVIEDRAKNAQRQADWQAKKKGENAPQDAPINEASNETANDVTNAVSESVPSPYPSPYPGPIPVPNENQVAPNGASAHPRQKKPQVDYSEEFASFWQEYPRKMGKSEAQKSYLRARQRGTPAEVILAGAINYAATCRLKQTDAQYICLPRTFLNNERWLDYGALSLNKSGKVVPINGAKQDRPMYFSSEEAVKAFGDEYA